MKEDYVKMLIITLAAERASVLMRDWLHTDVRTAMDWEMIQRLYAGCKALGYSGGLDTLYKECKEIPINE